MGGGRDKRKKNKPTTAGKGAEKTEKKTDKNSDKATRRLERKAQGGEDDIESLLAAFKLEDDRQSSVVVQEDCAPPSPRVYASFIPLPLQREEELIMYGGEWLDGGRDKLHTYSDLYILNVARQAWRRVISPKGPLPRSAHQAVTHKGYMYVFGGEFTSLNQQKFKHYGDLWRLSLTDWSWEQLPSKGGPSPRSGHRMAAHKGRLLLFGGFYESGKEMRYYNDLWEFCLEGMRWAPLGPRPGQAAPAPRGGCQLALHGDAMFVFGGAATRKTERDPAAPGGKGKRKGEDEDDGKLVIHDDVWCLDLKTHEWERVKKAGMSPTPRTSFALAVHRKRAVVFGGVHDREGAGDKVYSELFNELYHFNLESRRWFPLALRPPPKPKADAAAAAAADAPAEQVLSAAAPAAAAAAPPPGVSPEMHAALSAAMADSGSALHRAAARIQARYRGYVVRKAYTAYRLGGQVSELLYSPATYGIDLSAKDMIKPRARSAPMMAVLKNTLWMWGGIVEVAHTDVVLDDVWSLDLAKLDGWRCVKENSCGEEAFKDESDWESGSGSDDSG